MELNRANRFSSCHAVFMTAVLMPPEDRESQRFCLALCCDRRGDKTLEFRKNLTSFRQVENLWGSDEHWQIFEAINLENCPRCTYQPHNQIFEHVIQKDSMNYKFI